MVQPATPKVKIIDAAFVAEARALEHMPGAGPISIAIAGRSNVGKSTLLNRLAARRNLARTSKTPGRTRGLLVYDLVIEVEGKARIPLRLVDLPGFGYAKVARSERKSWGPLVEGFVTGPYRVALVLVLIDGRRGPNDEERQLCDWLAEVQAPYRVVVTKIDQLTAGERGLVPERMAKAMHRRPGAIVAVSAQSGFGMEKLWHTMLRAVPQVEGQEQEQEQEQGKQQDEEPEEA